MKTGELILRVENSQRQRKSNRVLFIVCATAITLILIWTTEVPIWLQNISPYVHLNFVCIVVAVLWGHGDAEKNETALLDRLKKEANGANALKI